jgi:hypothetical protein
MIFSEKINLIQDCAEEKHKIKDVPIITPLKFLVSGSKTNHDGRDAPFSKTAEYDRESLWSTSTNVFSSNVKSKRLAS